LEASISPLFTLVEWAREVLVGIFSSPVTISHALIVSSIILMFDREGLAMRLKIRGMVSAIDVVIDKAINLGS